MQELDFVGLLSVFVFAFRIEFSLRVLNVEC